MTDLKVFAGDSFFYPIQDNSYLCFKVLEPSDRERFLEGFKNLSPQSIYHRFFGVVKELSEKQLTELLNTDRRNNVAWAAFDIINNEPFGIGVGRFKRSPTVPEEAELALTVIDEYQNRGAGTVLLGIMYHLGILLDIKVFTGLIMSDNSRLIRRFIDLGADMKRVGTEYEMRLPLFKDFNQFPQTRYAQLVKPVLTFLEDNNFCG
jgi:GNAT superfamily N-acetyltransferase